jgi:hypothetical protein
VKVDLGTCAVCGAKNSKFVQACYKCGAALPWAAGYSAPEAKPNQQPASSPRDVTPAEPVSLPKPAPQATLPKVTPPTNGPTSDVKTVASPQLLGGLGEEKASLTDSLAERATRRVPVPTWAICAGALGCLAFGMALMTAFGGRNSTPPTSAPPALTPLPTLAPAVVAPPVVAPPVVATPASLTPMPAETPTGATGATPAGVTSGAGANPVANGTPGATVLPTSVPTSTPSPPSGPAFDTLYSNTTTGTKEQQAAYWKTVQGSKVSWRGDFISLGNSPGGPLQLRCRVGTNSSPVIVHLSTNPSQTLPPMQPNQSISVEGLLTGYSPTGYEISQGRIN